MPQPLRVVALVNQGSGTAQGAECQALLHRLAAAFERGGASVELELLAGGGLAAAAARARDRALRGEIDALVVGGGDGTIRTAAHLLADTGVPLGVIPLGTFNHFARDLGLPLDPEAAVEVICARAARPVDAGEVNGQVFVNNSSIGIYPAMVRNRERIRQASGLAKWGAMLLACLRVLRWLPVRRLSIAAEGWTEPCRSPCVFVGNNEYGIEAASFGKRLRLDRGELCLYVARQRSRLALVWLGIRSAFGLLDRERDMRFLRTSAAEIHARGHGIWVALDGEVEKLRSPLRYRSRPAALLVFAPPAGAGTGVAAGRADSDEPSPASTGIRIGWRTDVPSA